MSEVGIRALKQNASAVVARVAAGASVTVTLRGQPVAQMSPLPVGRLESLLRSGRARPALGGFSDLPSPADAVALGPTLSAELEEMRQAERY